MLVRWPGEAPLANTTPVPSDKGAMPLLPQLPPCMLPTMGAGKGGVVPLLPEDRELSGRPQASFDGEWEDGRERQL